MKTIVDWKKEQRRAMHAMAPGVLLSAGALLAATGPAVAQPAVPITVTDYDENDW